MNTLLLHPTDVLFFRDGRPMEGSLAGHGAAWPLPSVVDAALHAALHRSELPGHAHDHRHRGERTGTDARQFGSLVTAGPFPVRDDKEWFFPRPLDLGSAALVPTLQPSPDARWREHSSLPTPLSLAVASTAAPTKDSEAKSWLSGAAYQTYLAGPGEKAPAAAAVDDREIFEAEATVGIGMDAATGTQDGERIYSARYLRLRPHWSLGCLAKTAEKQHSGLPEDVIPSLFAARRAGDAVQSHIVIGGQQRSCTAKLQQAATLHLPLPLPAGRTKDFKQANLGHGPRWLVKWILLSPAIWPEIAPVSIDGRPMTPHPGGWLPNWVDATSGRVLLRHRTGTIRRDYSGPRHRRTADSDMAIAADLVAARVAKALTVTGWALAHEAAQRPGGGAKSTHLAVPAGSVYYFSCDSADAAAQLAAALNWHGADSPPDTIRHRRSTLLGEKGFGLGVCGTWTPHTAR